MALSFKLIPVQEKPLNRLTKDMYKDIIREFIDEGFGLAEVLVDVKNKSYVKSMLQSCIVEMELEYSVIVSIINNRCYLERY